MAPPLPSNFDAEGIIHVANHLLAHPVNLLGERSASKGSGAVPEKVSACLPIFLPISTNLFPIKENLGAFIIQEIIKESGGESPEHVLADADYASGEIMATVEDHGSVPVEACGKGEGEGDRRVDEDLTYAPERGCYRCPKVERIVVAHKAMRKAARENVAVWTTWVRPNGSKKLCRATRAWASVAQAP